MIGIGHLRMITDQPHDFWTCGAQTKSLARNHKTGCICSGSASAPPSNCTRGQTHVIWQNRTMTRNDVLVWLSLAGLFAAYCATLWVFFPLGD